MVCWCTVFHTLWVMIFKRKVFCAKLCHFLSHLCYYIQKHHTNQAFCKGGMQSLSIYTCFVSELNTEMTSQSKLDPFSRLSSMGQKSPTTEGKIILGQKLFWHSNQGSSESSFMQKAFWELVAL